MNEYLNKHKTFAVYHQLFLMIQNIKLNFQSIRKNRVRRIVLHRFSNSYSFSEFRENLRMRLLIDIGKLLGKPSINK
jgi:hypothetical protein